MLSNNYESQKKYIILLAGVSISYYIWNRIRTAARLETTSTSSKQYEPPPDHSDTHNLSEETVSQQYYNDILDICQFKKGFFQYVCIDCLNENNFLREKELLKKGVLHPTIDFLPIICEECYLENHKSHQFIRISRLDMNIAYEHCQCVCGNDQVYKNECQKHQSEFFSDLTSQIYGAEDIKVSLRKEIVELMGSLAHPEAVNSNKLKLMMEKIQKIVDTNSKFIYTLSEVLNSVNFLNFFFEKIEKINTNKSISQTIASLFYRIYALQSNEFLLKMLQNFSKIIENESIGLVFSIMLSNKAQISSLASLHLDEFTKIIKEFEEITMKMGFYEVLKNKDKLLTGINILQKIFSIEQIQEEFTPVLLKIAFNLQTKFPQVRDFLKLIDSTDLGHHLAALKEVDFMFRQILIYSLTNTTQKDNHTFLNILQIYYYHLEEVFYETQEQVNLIFASSSLTFAFTTICAQLINKLHLPVTIETRDYIMLYLFPDRLQRENFLRYLRYSLNHSIFFMNEGLHILQLFKLGKQSKYNKIQENKQLLNKIQEIYTQPSFGDYDMGTFINQFLGFSEDDLVSLKFKDNQTPMVISTLLDETVMNNVVQADPVIQTKQIINILLIDDCCLSIEEMEEKIKKFIKIDTQELKKKLQEISFFDENSDCYAIKRQYRTKITPYLLARSLKYFEKGAQIVGRLENPKIDYIFGSDLPQHSLSSLLEHNITHLIQTLHPQTIQANLKEQMNLTLTFICLIWGGGVGQGGGYDQRWSLMEELNNLKKNCKNQMQKAEFEKILNQIL